MAKRRFSFPLKKNGRPLQFGYVYTYIAGTDIAKATYSTASGANLNTNPVRLDINGNADIFLNPGEPYRVVVKDQENNIVWEFDNIVLADEPARGWLEERGFVKYVSQTQFSVEGNKLAIYANGKLVKLLQPGGGSGYTQNAFFDAPTNTTTVTLAPGSSSVAVGIQGVMYRNTENSSFIPPLEAGSTWEIKDSSGNTIVGIDEASKEIKLRGGASLESALTGDIHIELIPSTASSSAATVTASAAGTFKKTITIKLVDSSGNVHTWANLSLSAVSAENVADTNVLAPTISSANPALINGVGSITLTYDTDGGSTKTYAAGDSISLTVEAPTSGILGYPVASTTFTDTFV